MTFETANPARDGVAAGLGDVSCCQAIDYRDIALPIAEVQTEFIASCCYVAELGGDA